MVIMKWEYVNDRYIVGLFWQAYWYIDQQNDESTYMYGTQRKLTIQEWLRQKLQDRHRQARQIFQIFQKYANKEIN